MKTFNIKTLLVALMAIVSVNSFAQEKEKGARYILNGFWDNWYISAGAGAQSFWGSKPDGYVKSSLTDQATITYGVAVGKWITPSFGVRAHGMWTPAAKRYQLLAQTPTTHNKSMNIINAGAEATFNLSNAIGGYKDSRFYSIIPYVGAAYFRTNLPDWKWDNKISANAGIINKFRLGEYIDFNIELGAVAMAKTADGIVHSNYPYDAQYFAMASLTYRFGNKHFEKYEYVEKIDLTPYNNKIKELENAVSAANSKASELQKRVMELQNKKPVVEVKQTVIDLAGATTFFNIGSSKLGPRDLVNIAELADFIKQTPDVKYKLSGLIDYSCGSRQLNDKLCAARVDAVYNELVKNGVQESQLVKSSETPASPSKNPILNRGVVVSTAK